MNWKDILIIIVILITVIGCLFAIEYWGTPKEETKGPELPKITGEEKEITKEEKEESISPKSEIEWQEFKVEKYGFSIKIPIDYKKTDFIEMDPKKSPMSLIASFFRNKNEGFTLSINNEGEKDAKEAKETYQLEFERRESLEGKYLFPEAKLISIQKLEKKECPIFIFSLEKNDKTFHKLVFLFPAYRKELVFQIGFDYPSQNEEEKVWEMINSIECHSP
jgi:hypothetical protein